MDARLTGVYAGINRTGVSTFLPSLLLLFHSLPFSYPLTLLPSPTLFFLPLPSSFLRSRVPLNQLASLESAVSCYIGGCKRCKIPAEDEFGALLSCQKPTGDNHFECSKVHVLHLLQ